MMTIPRQMKFCDRSHMIGSPNGGFKSKHVTKVRGSIPTDYWNLTADAAFLRRGAPKQGHAHVKKSSRAPSEGRRTSFSRCPSSWRSGQAPRWRTSRESRTSCPHGRRPCASRERALRACPQGPYGGAWQKIAELKVTLRLTAKSPTGTRPAGQVC